MNNCVLFIQGGGNGGYEADKKLAASLQTALGETYEVRYPQLLSDKTLSDFGWPMQIGKEIADIRGNIILVAHSSPKMKSKKRFGRFSLSLHHFGKATRIANKVLNYIIISPISCQKKFRFFFITAVMTKKYHLKTFCFMRKDYLMPPFVK